MFSKASTNILLVLLPSMFNNYEENETKREEKSRIAMRAGHRLEWIGEGVRQLADVVVSWISATCDVE